jgi:hypothetical protein
VVLSFDATGDREQALELIGNAAIASVQLPQDRDLNAVLIERSPSDLRSAGDFQARPKAYHFGATVFEDAAAERLLAERATAERGQRDVPVRTLKRDPDPAFRPGSALEASQKLDRVLVPLLNVIAECGCIPYFSCGGHLNLTAGTRALSDSNPYVMLDASARAAAIARRVASLFESWQIQVSRRRGGMRLVLRLSDALGNEEPVRPRTVEERRALDRRLVKAAAEVDPSSFSDIADGPCEERLLIERVGVRSAADWTEAVPSALIREHAVKEPIFDDRGARVAPLVGINEFGPAGTCELRLMNYDVGEGWLDARVAAPSFTELRTAVEAAFQI